MREPSWTEEEFRERTSKLLVAVENAFTDVPHKPSTGISHVSVAVKGEKRQAIDIYLDVRCVAVYSAKFMSNAAAVADYLYKTTRENFSIVKVGF